MEFLFKIWKYIPGSIPNPYLLQLTVSNQQKWVTKNIGCKRKLQHSPTWSINFTYLKEINYMNHGDNSSNNEYYLLCITMSNVSKSTCVYLMNNPMFILGPNNKDISQINKSVYKAE